MNEQITKLYPAICRWLGLREYTDTLGRKAWIDKNDGLWYECDLDFLNDLNQLQWVEKKLKKLGYDIIYKYSKDFNNWTIILKGEYEDPFYPPMIFREKKAKTKNKSRPLALLEAVMELINKENG